MCCHINLSRYSRPVFLEDPLSSLKTARQPFMSLESHHLSTKPSREVSYQGPWGTRAGEDHPWHCALYSKRIYIYINEKNKCLSSVCDISVSSTKRNESWTKGMADIGRPESKGIILMGKQTKVSPKAGMRPKAKKAKVVYGAFLIK